MLCGITKGPVYACKEAAKLDWKPQFLFPGPAAAEYNLALAGDSVFYGKALLGTNEYFPISFDHPNKKLLLKWLKEDPEKKDINLANTMGLTYAKTILEGIKRAGKDLTVEGFIKAMEGIKDWDNGGQALITFGPNDRQGVSKVLLFDSIKGPNGIGIWKTDGIWIEPRK